MLSQDLNWWKSKTRWTTSHTWVHWQSRPLRHLPLKMLRTHEFGTNRSSLGLIRNREQAQFSSKLRTEQTKIPINPLRLLSDLPARKSAETGILSRWSHSSSTTAITSSMYSGSLADASHRLLRIKTLGFERRWLTLWKKAFSVCIRVDSEFATSTKTSASRQYLSIQESVSGVTSIPGLSTRTTSSRRRKHLFFGHISRTNVCSLRCSRLSACDKLVTD